VGLLIWRDQLMPLSNKLEKKENKLSISDYQKKIQFVVNIQTSKEDSIGNIENIATFLNAFNISFCFMILVLKPFLLTILDNFHSFQV
jgi:nitrate/nitrite-specific signal transduction histidine kinase